MKKHLDGYRGPEPPDHIYDALKRRMSHVTTDFPILRMVWSEAVMEKIGCEWHDWDPGVAHADRGTMSNVLDMYGNPIPLAKPIRVVTEVREIPKYSTLDSQGWMLERFFPAAMYGSPEAWASHVVPGTNVSRLGPYPSQGRYEQIAGPFPVVPNMDFLGDFISHHERITHARLAQDLDTHIRLRVEAFEAEEEKKREASKLDVITRLHDSTSYLTGSSLAAGRLRTKATEAVGMREHYGN